MPAVPAQRSCPVPETGQDAGLERPDQGPARALIGSLWTGRCWIGRCGTALLDGLATSIRIRLSSLSAGPDAMVDGVVVAGWPSAAIVPILSKSAGRDKPRNRIGKSTCSCHHGARL